MAKSHHPRRGSMQFWPRKRVQKPLARIRSWNSSSAGSLGFIGFKAGMATVMVADNRPKSMTKGETIALPVTVIECPALKVVGVSFYQKTLFGTKKVGFVFAPKLDSEVARRISVPTKAKHSLDTVPEFDYLRILVQTQPKLTGIGTKIPSLLEMAVGGSKDDQLAFAKEKLGQDLAVTDVFAAGAQVDVHGVTKGKGFQGTVKRFGVPIRQHKSEKTKRGIGNLGAWTPKRVDFRTPQSGKMGHHMRTHYNKQVVALGDNGADVTPKGGFGRYGVVKNNYLLIKGSVPGPVNGSVVLTNAIRPNKKFTKEAFALKKVLQ